MSRRMSVAARLLRRIARHYLKSHDFNGILLETLLVDEEPKAIETLKTLIRQGDIEIISGSWDNPYIKRLPAYPIDKQLKAIEFERAGTICVYPTTKYMRRVLPNSAYPTKPFTRALALAHPQLEPVLFELSVLERYQSDPRYIFRFDGLAGHISVTADAYRSGVIGRTDKVILQTFGLGSNARGHRAAAVFLRDLSSLTARHQQHWQSHRLSGKFVVEENYFRRSVFGEFTDGISVYQALLAELLHINRMCEMIGLPPLFRRDLSDSDPGESATDGKELNEPPQGFGLLMKCTRRGYFDFVHVLDKVVVENLNADFFAAQGIRLEEEITRRDGRKSIIQRGTLQLLEDWLTNYVHIRAENGPARIVEPLRRVHKLRQEPAHNFINDEFSLQYQRKKEALIVDVYTSIANIRMFFETHPRARNYEFPERVDRKNILVY